MYTSLVHNQGEQHQSLTHQYTVSSLSPMFMSSSSCSVDIRSVHPWQHPLEFLLEYSGCRSKHICTIRADSHFSCSVSISPTWGVRVLRTTISPLLNSPLQKSTHDRNRSSLLFRQLFDSTVRSCMDFSSDWFRIPGKAALLSRTFVPILEAVMKVWLRNMGCQISSGTKKFWSISTSPIFTTTFGHAAKSSSMARVRHRVVAQTRWPHKPREASVYADQGNCARTAPILLKEA